MRIRDPNAISNHVFARPSAAHWLGTDNLGRDVYAQVIDGTRNVLILALAVGLLTTAVAMLIGVAAAYLGGLWDSVLNFVTDVLLVIPIFPLLIIIAAYLPNAGNNVLILVLTFTGWSYTARQLRSQAQSLRNRDFLLAARVRGERPLYIIVVEILPTMTSLLLASFLNNALYAVLAGSGLQFIGLGNTNNVSWGTTLYWAQQNNALGSGLYVWAIVPGACIALHGRRVRLHQLRLRRDRQPGPAPADRGEGPQGRAGQHQEEACQRWRTRSLTTSTASPARSGAAPSWRSGTSRSSTSWKAASSARSTMSAST